MGYCTGTGQADGDHCCYVNGAVCPHLMDAATIDAWISAQGWGATKQAAARAYAANIRWTCRIGIQVLADVTAARNNRARYEQEFAANADYQAFPAPQWRSQEQANGLAAGSLDCYRWKGWNVQCCYRLTTAESDAIAAQRGITSQALTVRRAGGT